MTIIGALAEPTLAPAPVMPPYNGEIHWDPFFTLTTLVVLAVLLAARVAWRRYRAGGAA